MKRSIVIIACVIAAVVIIPLVAQTSRSVGEDKVCPMGQAQACKTQCEEAKNCEACPKKATGECQGCEKQCQEGETCGQCPKTGCPKTQDATAETTPGCGMGGGCGMGAGMMRGCGMGQGAEI